MMKKMLIEFKFNKQKAIEVILFFANKRPSIDEMSLYKFMFFADEEHLNRYGRTIFGGHYVAMPYGPVPSQVRDLLRKENHTEFVTDDYMITAQRKPDLNYLSASDIEVMNLIYKKLKNYSARQLSDLSHQHRAWNKARNTNSLRNNNRVDFKDMIREENTELINELEESSKYILI